MATRKAEQAGLSMPRIVKRRSSISAATYNVLAYPSWEPLARRLAADQPERFCHVPIKWGKFSDSQMDHIVVGGFTPTNTIRRSRILFLADFSSNDAILSQLHVRPGAPFPGSGARPFGYLRAVGGH